MNHRLKALMASVGVLTLAAAPCLAQTNLPPQGVGPAPFVAFKDAHDERNGHAYATSQTSFTTTGTSTAQPCVAGTVTLEFGPFGGSNTAISGQLYRSDSDPASTQGANYQPVGSAQSGVDPATGVAPVTATEGSYAWWAYKVTSITGPPGTVSIGCPVN